MTRHAARLVPADRTGLPGWCDPFLADPAAGEFFASRAWYDTLLAHALPAGTAPLLAVCGPGDAVLLPLGRRAGRLAALASPYALDWRPLPAPGADAVALRGAGQGLGRLLRWRRPAHFELLDPAAPGLAPLLEGLAATRIRALRYRHTGNWHEPLAPGTGWDAYLAARPSVLRSTIARKLSRAARALAFEPVEAPGAALEAGIAAYGEVRARSWKPDEPFPDFDAALLRVVAGLGLLRLGILRDRGDGTALAARRADSPGTVLTALMIRRLLEQDGVAELDFGRGDDEYKQLWVGIRRQRIGLVLADPLHPAGLVALLRQAVGRLRRGLGKTPA